jgi:hypothetical protein
MLRGSAGSCTGTLFIKPLVVDWNSLKEVTLEWFVMRKARFFLIATARPKAFAPV